MQHDELAVLPFEVDRNVPSIFDGQIRHVRKRHEPIVSELVFFVGIVHVGLAEDLDVLGKVVVRVDVHSFERSDFVERENEVQRSAVRPPFPSEPIVACKTKLDIFENYFFN